MTKVDRAFLALMALPNGKAPKQFAPPAPRPPRQGWCNTCGLELETPTGLLCEEHTSAKLLKILMERTKI